MVEPQPAEQRARRFSWTSWLDDWRLRTKVAVVLLIPVVVALGLGGMRVSSQWDEASRLSSVRDQVTVLRGVIELAGLVDKETITAVAATPPEGLDIKVRAAAVDQKSTEVQNAADHAGLPPEVGRALSAAIGRLSALRSAGRADPVTTSAGYHEVVGQLSEVVTGVVASANSSELDTAANSVRLLLQLQSTLSVEEGLLRSVESGSIPAVTIQGAQRAASEETVLGQQLSRAVHGDTAAAFADATTSAPSRHDVIDSALSIDLTAELRGLLPGIESELDSLNGILDGYVTTLADQITAGTTDARNSALRDGIIVVVALLVALVIALLVARSIVRPIGRLHRAVRKAAEEELPETVQRIIAGEAVDWSRIEPVGVSSNEEIGQLARGFDEMHRQAVRMAAEQADLRRQVSEMFMTLSRRSQSLVELQLSEIETLESQEQDPQRLDSLFRLDHLATRLRRNGENLQVLAGGAPARRDQGPVTVVELLRAATSAVKDYRRVSVGRAPSALLRGHAAADVVHVLAELLENATRFSPPDQKVLLTADRGTDGGLLVEVVDRGLGMTAEDLAAANERLAATGAANPDTTRRMGLFVVSKLAERHGVTVRLRSTTSTAGKTGITASVHVPGDLIVAGGTDAEGAQRGPEAESRHSQKPVPPSTQPSQPLQPSQSMPSLQPMQPLQSTQPSQPLLPDIPAPAPAPAVSQPLPTVKANPTFQPSSGLHARPVPPRNPAPTATNGHTAPGRPPATPIFDQLASRWFTPEPVDEDEPPQPPVWHTPADAAWRAAGEAVGPPAKSVPTPPPPVGGTTSAGLPMRKPGARLAPGALTNAQPNNQNVARPATPGGKGSGTATDRGDFRDPAAIRNNLSRHYEGMRRARQRTKAEPDKR
ncbi:ATP-binding protein [Labedaea rhizosphaerae]|uniref:histidine kinase n=1 Tax=Labedaea rhizosphaerae TaxID=598644 RepID=A0A4R6SK38_LABRH|nr:ATP-binding protein [Labedaea rhizosphaerae]TDQ01388.1 signal transduction histidine kinase [Labedaea rhizosphaerae]